jgi:hypothetical protein
MAIGDTTPGARPLEALLDGLLQGAEAQDLPREWRSWLKSLGLPLAEDPATAFLEAVALSYYLEESAPPATLAEDPSGPATENEAWTPARLRVLRDLLAFPHEWVLPELAAVLRRQDLFFPKAVWPTLLEGLASDPEQLLHVADRLDERARRQARARTNQHFLFPQSPPDPVRTGPDRSARHVYHWLWQEPAPAMEWLRGRPAGVDAAWWRVFLPAFAHRLPPEAKGLLPLLQEAEALPPDLRYARCLLGDSALEERALGLLGAMIGLEGGQLHWSTPSAQPVRDAEGLSTLRAWADQIEGGGRDGALRALVKCVSLSDLADSLGTSLPEFLALAFDSPDAERILPALAASMQVRAEPEARLAWWRERLADPEGPDPGDDLLLARGLPHDRLSALLAPYLSDHRTQFRPEDPAGRVLAGGSLYWTENLTREFLTTLELRPALAAEVSRHPRLFPALLWRGNLGVWARYLQGTRPLADLAPPLQKRRDEILPVIQGRILLHQAFQRS